jgi:hypothetical protein
MRLAILCTPRTGNVWLRTLLGDLYGIPTTAVPNPAEVDWERLPPECVLAVHWHRTSLLVQQLRQAGFRVLVPARHPLDVLISILQFCLHDNSTLRWLEGENGNERPIYGSMPGSAAFLDYATGPRAASLLGVSPEWWSDPEALRVRYEDLVADTQGELSRLAEQIGEPPRQPVAQVAAGAGIAQIRQRLSRWEHHFWQGRPGLWKTLLTGPVAERIAEAHPAYFNHLGYRCDPDPLLTPGQADANWIRLVWFGVAEKLQQSRQTLLLLAEAQRGLSQLEAQQAALHQQMQADRRALQHAHRAACAELARFRELGPIPLRLARQLRDLSHRLPRVAAAVKGVGRLSSRAVRFASRAVRGRPSKTARDMS